MARPSPATKPATRAQPGPAAAAAPGFAPSPSHEDILGRLGETDPDRLELLWRRADETRLATVGDQVHLRGLIEISNHCVRQCGYCGLRGGNRTIERYRMGEDEILACAHEAVAYGYGTVVLQAGEDPGLTCVLVAHVVRRIKAETGLAVTLSLGERSLDDLRAWREAGADRYLLRFETSDPVLYRRIHPPAPGRPGFDSDPSDRLDLLRELRSMGYEIGSGIMVGIPGQTLEIVARDIELFRTMDLDMIGVGPYIPHPRTPLGAAEPGAQPAAHEGPGQLRAARAPRATAEDQAPNDELMVYKTVALTRLVCPQANIPSTTALATINKESGREIGLQRGANIVMPNLTPPKYRVLYEIYPEKACINETAEMCRFCLLGRIESIGRHVGAGPGGRCRA
jgi:biotin synthase